MPGHGILVGPVLLQQESVRLWDPTGCLAQCLWSSSHASKVLHVPKILLLVLNLHLLGVNLILENG